MLDVYGHMIPTMQTEAAQKIDELITPVDVSQLHPICTRNEPESYYPISTPPYLGIK